MIATLILAASIAIPPRPSDYVTDNAAALSSAARDRIGAELQNYEAATGHHIIVWIGQTTGDTPLEDWTIHAAEQWKVGRKGSDDGAILFLFMRDHKVRIEVGYGLESKLTDASASEIIRNTIVPKMREGNPDAAVQDGVDRMLLTITPSYAPKIDHAVSAQPGNSSSDPLLPFIILFVFIILLFVFFGGARRRARGAWLWGGVYPAGFSGGSSSYGGGSSGGGFSGGSFGGGFGGGGASGGW